MQAATLIVLTGPTAVGKTELSLSIAQRYGAEILSADSRQMYRDLKIGTAAPTPRQLAQVPHHFVGNLSLDDYYSAARFEEEALALLARKFETHPVMLATGGSMMYIDALCHGIDDLPTVDEESRRAVQERYQSAGLEQLCSELRLLDPEYHRQADLKNPKRVMHALEICYMTGRPYSSFLTHRRKSRPFKIIKVALQRPREELYSRIARRVEQMMQQGLLDEARTLYPHRHLNSLNTVGYKELFAHLDGQWELPFAIEKIKQNTRIYSRKQMTWLRRDEETHWLDAGQPQAAIDYIDHAIQQP